MKYTYKTQDTCAQEISFDINDDIITDIIFTGGCNGNLKAIPKLIDGLSADTIIEKCSGIMCGRRPTSCVDQLSIAINQARIEVTNGLQCAEA